MTFSTGNFGMTASGGSHVGEGLYYCLSDITKNQTLPGPRRSRVAGEGLGIERMMLSDPTDPPLRKQGNGVKVLE
jgi:hypothetical protein